MSNNQPLQHSLLELLPNEISDETAYHLSNFVIALATALDEIYFAKTLRYMRDSQHNKQCASAILEDKELEDPPF